ncbi:MAG: amidohydrolase family protein [Candidatus Humimicrobiaceae bacterium]
MEPSPRVINRYIRTKKTLTPKQVIEKFTSKTAERLNIKGRGYLKTGCFADIVVFDLDSFKDYPDSKTFKPKIATGVKYLFINGKIIINDGIKSNSKSGSIIQNN